MTKPAKKSAILPPARLSFSIAKNAPVAVIIRQGPSRWVRMIRWDMTNDTFELGQWLHARVPNFDLSADGRYVLSFVQGYRARDTLGTWVAISRPPWFSALAVWKIGDSWGGACLFVKPRSIYIGHGLTPATLEKGRLPKGWTWTSTPPTEEAFAKQLTWKRVGAASDKLFEKPCGASGWMLTAKSLTSAYRYVLVSPEGTQVGLRDATCADVDVRGRVIEARKDGCIYVWKKTRDGWRGELILDTNAMKPDPKAAPAEALRWGK